MDQKSPAFQWYPKDILASARVATMSLAEEGAYRRALDYCWINGHLPACTKQLSLLIGKGCTNRIALRVKEMFEERGGKLYHQRLDEERTKQELFRQKQSLNGKKGGRPRNDAEVAPPPFSGACPELVEGGGWEGEMSAEEKGLGFSGLDQTKANESSSTTSSSPSSTASATNFDTISHNNATFLSEKNANARENGTSGSQKPDLLFKDSPYYDFAAFEAAFQGTDYAHCDLRYYHERAKNWSASTGAKKRDWIATVRNFMLGDASDNKLKLKPGTVHHAPTTAHNRPAKPWAA